MIKKITNTLFGKKPNLLNEERLNKETIFAYEYKIFF